MTTVAKLSADLTANTSKFDDNLQRASKTLRRTGGQMSRSAESFNKKVSNSFRNAAQTAAAMDGPLGGVAGRLSSLGSIASSTGVLLGGLVLSVASLGVALKKAVTIGDSFEGSMNRVNAVIKATGGTANLTAQEIRDFSQELARGTLASVEGVEAASAKLLTFRSVAGETFKRTIVLAQDLAATGFGTIESNAVSLGKALEDPIRNLGALTRNGVSFTQKQKDVIKALVETGNQAKAQGIILDTLAKQVGGAGAGEGGQLSRAYDSLTQSIENFFVALGNRTGAGGRFTQFIATLDESLQTINRRLAGKSDTITKQLENAFERLDELLEQAKDEADDFFSIGQSDKLLEGAIAAQRRLIDILRQRKLEEELAAMATKEAAERQKEKNKVDEDAVLKEAERLRRQEESKKQKEQRAEAVRQALESAKDFITVLENDNKILSDNTVSLEDAATAREILTAQQQLGIAATSEEGRAIADLIIKRREFEEEGRKATQDRRNVEEIIKANKTEVDLLQERMREYERLRDARLLGEEEYQKAVARTREELAMLDERQEEIRMATEQMRLTWNQAFKDFVTGATTAREAVRSLTLKLADLFLDRAANSIFTTVGSSSIGAAISSVFGGFFENGGRPPMGKISVVGESGPELFVPDNAGTIIPSSEISASGGGGTTIYADMRGASAEAVGRLERLVVDINASIEPRAVSAVVESRQRDPALFGVTS